ncbi:DNA-binding IclR family transcriptional regulator [Virgibacillus halotolerans]|uniref:IclR family transcriptional regulator n=1 Tax=Virgibacillus halotolerans TaxID=1071053 RepID=UPI0019620EB4|nr:IclR family transcriptional regulator [Virgibacillus halotolerans]MBM7601984.1 DNA-binding IclR family transcriptional regulator [Virgibacillus halotolerans]
MNQSVIKAMKLLDLFTEGTPELTLKEISAKANMPKPTAYRLLSALESSNMLYKTKENEHDSRYRLGLKLLELGQIVSEQIELREIALPYMEQLAEEINEVIHLVIINQNEATYIEKVESTKALRLFTKIGKSVPLYMGSGPKLLLAHLSEEKQEAVLSADNLQSFHNHPPVDKDKLKKELAMIRQAGYAYSIGEQDADTTGISYPLYDYRDQMIAALTVSGLSSYYEGEGLERIKRSTAQTAQRISEELGYRNSATQLIEGN